MRPDPDQIVGVDKLFFDRLRDIRDDFFPLTSVCHFVVFRAAWLIGSRASGSPTKTNGAQ